MDEQNLPHSAVSVEALGKHYIKFLEFVQQDLQKDRFVVHRRMLSVFLWGFIIPAAVALVLLLLVSFHVLPARFRGSIDLVTLIFPVCYSIYVLGSEVLVRLPGVLRRGGLSGLLDQAARDSVWREQVCTSLQVVLPLHTREWNWVIESFETDLRGRLRQTSFLTGLAGAIFFLMFQGVDILAGGDVEARLGWSRNTTTGLIETSTSDLTQFVALALFLGLFYLSGVQNVRALQRYLDCAKLLIIARKS